MPETTPLPIAEIPAPKANRGRPRKSEVRPPIPLPNGDRLVPRKQQAALLGVCERTLVRLRVPTNLGIPVSGLYLLAAPSTPPEAVDEMIECAKSGERQIKGKIDKVKRVKATAAGIKPKRGSSKQRTKAEGLTAPVQETIKEWNQMLLKIVSYVLERDGRVDPNDTDLSVKGFKDRT